MQSNYDDAATGVGLGCLVSVAVTLSLFDTDTIRLSTGIHRLSVPEVCFP